MTLSTTELASVAGGFRRLTEFQRALRAGDGLALTAIATKRTIGIGAAAAAVYWGVPWAYHQVMKAT